PTARHPGDLGYLGHRRRANAPGAHALLGGVDEPVADGLRGGRARQLPLLVVLPRSGVLTKNIVPTARRYARGADMVDTFRYLFTLRTKAANDGGHSPAVDS